MHYTIHIRGMYHPKLMPNYSSKWFYHDGMKDGSIKEKFVQGLLFENEPRLEVDLLNNQLKPYILIYRVVSKSCG